ncbi:MAG: helix-turn-helix domain-containing protein [Chloroflexota bacterium]|nr:helix-turn-helix domain-containing protein [Chloroflexota bacterium]
MATSKLDLLLHPVRLRILQSLIGQQLTTQQIAELLPDVAQATLYRQLNRLVDAGLIQVVEENPVRGAVEKVYALHEDASTLTREELAQASRDEHLRYFTVFLMTLLGDFARYLERDDWDFEADGVGYRQVALYLSDEELLQLTSEMNHLVRQAAHNRPNPERRRRLLSTILIPQEEAK